MAENKNTPSLDLQCYQNMKNVSDFQHLVPHICGSNRSVELLTQQSKPFHAYKEAKVLRPHTHTARTIMLCNIHT